MMTSFLGLLTSFLGLIVRALLIAFICGWLFGAMWWCFSHGWAIGAR